MIVECPACGAQFQVPDSAIPPSGREVRCGRCEYVWHHVPAAQAEAEAEVEAEARTEAASAPQAAPDAGAAESDATGTAQPEAQPAPEAARPTRPQRPARSAPLPKPRRSPALVTGWAALAVFVALVVLGGWYGRQELVARFPETLRIYSLLGVPVEDPALTGLELVEIDSVREERAGQKLLIVRGTIANVSARERRVPPLKVVITDSAGAPLAEWSFEAGSQVLAAGERTAFETSHAAPPPEAANLSIVFDPKPPGD